MNHFPLRLLALARSAKPSSLPVIALAAIALFGADTAQAQADGLGAYVGTINVSGTLIDPRGSYRASVKVTLPISKSHNDTIAAEFPAGEAPNVTALISDWDESYTEKSADSDGKYSSWSCSLPGAAEVPMSVTGVVNVDLASNTYALSVTLLSLEDIEFDCKNSRSGAYKKKEGISLYAGTGAPGMQFENPQPLTDPAHLAGKFTLNLKEAASANYGPIIQEWNLRRTP